MKSPNLNNRISDTLIIVGKNVKRYRLEKGLTQQELGYLSDNIERCTITNIERFHCNGVNLTTLIKIATTLEIDMEDLFKKYN